MSFSFIAYNDSLKQCLTKSFTTSFSRPNLGLTGLNQSQNVVFCHFFVFGLYAFLEIEYDDSLRQCLTEVRLMNKVFGAQILTKRVKIGLEIRFFAIFSNLIYYFSYDRLELYITSSRGKTQKKFWDSKCEPEISFFSHFLKIASLVFLDIAHDCSLGQFLTSSKVETSKQTFCGPN